MTKLHDRVATVIERVNKRSHDSRSAYLEDIEAMETAPDSDRRGLACSNLAHAAAGAGEDLEVDAVAVEPDDLRERGLVTRGDDGEFAVLDAAGVDGDDVAGDALDAIRCPSHF